MSGKGRLSFLSTGEISIDDKIEENSKYRALAGQSVRVVDLPIDEGNGQNAFTELHGFNNSKEFSDQISLNAKKYYGTAMREFLRKLCNDLENNKKYIVENLQQFYSANYIKDASGQVLRVLSKFALIDSAGKLAVDFGILPFSKESISDTCKHWFNIWIQQRDGIIDKEMIVVLKRIQEYFSMHMHEYIDEKNKNYYANKDVDPYCRISKDGYYFTPNYLANPLFKGVSKSKAVKLLEKKCWIAKLDKNQSSSTYKIDNHSHRGLFFIPSNWENEIY